MVPKEGSIMCLWEEHKNDPMIWKCIQWTDDDKKLLEELQGI